MSNLSVEAAEPEQTAVSLASDQAVDKNGAEVSAPGDADAVVADSKVTKEINEPELTKSESKNEENAVEELGKNAAAMGKKDDDEISKSRYGEYQKRRNDSKYDPSVLPTENDPKKIRAQVEFYFSDSNLPTDKHLWNLTDGTLNLPVKIDEILKFGRMKRFQPRSAVVEALRESSFLVVSGPEGMEEVKRSTPYDPKQPRSRTESRSVYVKGFGDEEPSSQFDIEAFFAPYGPVNCVRLRRTDQKLFKGSVFVEFQDDETAQKFLALDPKPKWKGKEPLTIKSKREYVSEKEQEIKDGITEPNEARMPFRGGYRGRGRGGDRDGDRSGKPNREKGDRDPDDWKKRREDDIKSGFKDSRFRDRKDRDRKDRDRDHRGSRGRGGRGRNGRDRDDREPRSNDRNRERDDKDGDSEKSELKDLPADKVENEKKREREEDGGAEEQPAKKVDTKTEISEVVAESS